MSSFYNIDFIKKESNLHRRKILESDSIESYQNTNVPDFYIVWK